MVASANQLHVEITADCTNAVDALDQTKSAIRNLNREAATVSVNLTGAQDAANQMEQVRQARMAAGGTVKVGVNSDDVDDAEQKLGSYRKAVQGLSKDLDPIGKTRLTVTLDSGSIRKSAGDMDEFSRSANRGRVTVDNLGSSVRAAQDDHDSYSRSLAASERNVRSLTAAHSEAERGYRSLADRADELSSKVQSVGAQFAAQERAVGQFSDTHDRSMARASASGDRMARDAERHASQYARAWSDAAKSIESVPEPVFAMAGGGAPEGAQMGQKISQRRTTRSSEYAPKPSRDERAAQRAAEEAARADAGGPTGPTKPPPPRGGGGGGGGSSWGDEHDPFSDRKHQAFLEAQAKNTAAAQEKAKREAEDQAQQRAKEYGKNLPKPDDDLSKLPGPSDVAGSDEALQRALGRPSAPKAPTVPAAPTPPSGVRAGDPLTGQMMRDYWKGRAKDNQELSSKLGFTGEMTPEQMAEQRMKFMAGRLGESYTPLSEGPFQQAFQAAQSGVKSWADAYESLPKEDAPVPQMGRGTPSYIADTLNKHAKDDPESEAQARAKSMSTAFEARKAAADEIKRQAADLEAKVVDQGDLQTELRAINKDAKGPKVPSTPEGAARWAARQDSIFSRMLGSTRGSVPLGATPVGGGAFVQPGTGTPPGAPGPGGGGPPGGPRPPVAPGPGAGGAQPGFWSNAEKQFEAEKKEQGGFLDGLKALQGPAMMGAMVSGAATVVAGLAGWAAVKQTIKDIPLLAFAANNATRQLAAGIEESGGAAASAIPSFQRLGDANRVLGRQVGQSGTQLLPQVNEMQTQMDLNAAQALKAITDSGVAKQALGAIGGVTDAAIQGVSKPAALVGESHVARAFGDANNDAGIANIISGVIAAGAPIAAAAGDLGGVVNSATGTVDKIISSATGRPAPKDATPDQNIATGISAGVGWIAAHAAGIPGPIGALLGATTTFQQAHGQDTTSGLATAGGTYGLMRSLGMAKGGAGLFGVLADLGSSFLPEPVRDITQHALTTAGVASTVATPMVGIPAGIGEGLEEATEKGYLPKSLAQTAMKLFGVPSAAAEATFGGVSPEEATAAATEAQQPGKPIFAGRAGALPGPAQQGYSVFGPGGPPTAPAGPGAVPGPLNPPPAPPLPPPPPKGRARRSSGGVRERSAASDHLRMSRLGSDVGGGSSVLPAPQQVLGGGGGGSAKQPGQSAPSQSEIERINAAAAGGEVGAGPPPPGGPGGPPPGGPGGPPPPGAPGSDRLPVPNVDKDFFKDVPPGAADITKTDKAGNVLHGTRDAEGSITFDNKLANKNTSSYAYSAKSGVSALGGRSYDSAGNYTDAVISQQPGGQRSEVSQSYDASTGQLTPVLPSTPPPAAGAPPPAPPAGGGAPPPGSPPPAPRGGPGPSGGGDSSQLPAPDLATAQNMIANLRPGTDLSTQGAGGGGAGGGGGGGGGGGDVMRYPPDVPRDFFQEEVPQVEVDPATHSAITTNVSEGPYSLAYDPATGKLGPPPDAKQYAIPAPPPETMSQIEHGNVIDAQTGAHVSPEGTPVGRAFGQFGKESKAFSPISPAMAAALGLSSRGQPQGRAQQAQQAQSAHTVAQANQQATQSAHSLAQANQQATQAAHAQTQAQTQATQASHAQSQAQTQVGQTANANAQAQQGQATATQGTAQATNSLGTATGTANASMGSLGNTMGTATASAAGLAQGAQSVASNVSSAVSGAQAGLSSLGTSLGQTGAEAGAAVGASLGAGAGSTSSTSAAAAGGAAAGAAAASGAASSDGADSQSPSRKTIQIGKWMGEGLAVGLHASEGMAAQAGASMASSAVSAATNGVAQTDYNTALAGGFGAGLIAAANGVTPIAQDYGLMIGYSWAENVVTGAQNVLKSADFTALTVPKFQSALAQANLGKLDLLPPAGSGAEYYTTTSGSAGMVQMPPITVTNTVMLDGQVIDAKVNTQINTSMNNLATSIGAQR